MFIIDEFTPQCIDDIFFHKKIYTHLKTMSNDSSIPHVIFHGPSGSGKKVMAKLFLKMIFGEDVDNVYTRSVAISGSGNKTKMENIKKSDHHIIINPTGTNFDRYIVHDVIKNYANTQTIDMVNNKSSSYGKFRCIQINNMDKLPAQSQTALRRMMELYNDKCRFIMLCNSLSGIIEPLQSRCVCVRVPRPREDNLFAYLVQIGCRKNCDIPAQKIIDIVDHSGRDVKKALWCTSLYMMGEDWKTTYEMAIDKIVSILLSIDIKKINSVRDMLFCIMITNIPAMDILRDIMDRIINSNKIRCDTKLNIVMKITEIGYNMARGRRDIIHFDYMVSSIMVILSKERENNKF